MRVPTLSMYMNSTQRLGRLTTDLNDATEVASTQKRINRFSDDPLGATQVIGLDQELSHMDQLNRNTTSGRVMLQGAETALTEVSKQLLNAKLLAAKMVNPGVGTKERRVAAQEIKKTLDQIIKLGNTQVNGKYVFAGTRNNIAPFSYNNKTNPPQVIYQGSNTPFSVATEKKGEMDVGLVGKTVFSEKAIKVDTTNQRIVFREDPGRGRDSIRTLEAELPAGTYSPKELAQAVRNAMNKTSEESGYKINYQVSQDPKTQAFTFSTDGSHPGYMGTRIITNPKEMPPVGGIKGVGIPDKAIHTTVLNPQALTRQTPVTSPLELSYKGDGKWQVRNDPGYDLPKEIQGSSSGVDLDLDRDGKPDLKINLDSPAGEGSGVKFHIHTPESNRSIGADMGLHGNLTLAPARGSSPLTLKTIDATNHVIDFKEDTGNGLSPQLTATLPQGKYSDMGQLAQAIEKSLEDASVNKLDYQVKYHDKTRKFSIQAKGAAELQLLWKSGSHQAGNGAAQALGFHAGADDTGTSSHAGDAPVSLIKIQPGVNDTINFKEISPGRSAEDTGQLTAVIPPGNYTDVKSFTRAVEKAMESASRAQGKSIDYAVTHDPVTGKISIGEDGANGRKLAGVKLMFQTGQDSKAGAASTLGFENRDISTGPAQGAPAQWGIFKTLIALKQSLETDDMDGLQRSITRLETHLGTMTTNISQLGLKNNRMDDTLAVNTELKVAMKTRKSAIEDVDAVEAIMRLKSLQTAYEASLKTTSQIMKLSLVDFL
ncbi:MAG: flagellar hook-associated protein FlgL [Desulfobacterales bacterium]|nr:flagellar hook-associated protein FlgL [Desulfobacterales bacterium]